MYNAKFGAKIAKNGHYALIVARWGETIAARDRFWPMGTRQN